MTTAQRCKQYARLGLAKALSRSGALAMLCRRPPSWRILMYHRITTPELCGYPLQPGMYVSPAVFAQHISYFTTHARLMPLQELTEMLLEGSRPPARSLAITFDDGWRDNYEYAYPVLKKHHAPAAVFLATSYIGTNNTFWSDAIPYAVGALRRAPKQASALLCESLAEFPVLTERVGGLLAAPQELLVEQLDAFITSLKPEPDESKEKMADKLTALAEEVQQRGRPRVFLNWDEVREMAENRIEFGSHSHYHRTLSRCSAEEIDKELERSYALLTEHGLSPLPVFCYPEGAYSAESQRQLACFGAAAAVTTRRKSDFSENPPLLGRTGLHQDISANEALLAARIWGNPLF